MTTEEFEALIEGAEEVPNLEFKGPMPWVRSTFLKDILALANVVDGGRLVVGIEDETYERIGLTDDQIATYVPDTMRDQIAPYADPSVSFSRSIVTGADGKKFIVIRVRPFDQDPVICKKQSDDVHAGKVYYRSSVGKPASAEVSNSTDMRTIIETAIARRLHALQHVGIIAPQPQNNALDEELGGL
jgi:predicted HTH transcriptional regulator